MSVKGLIEHYAKGTNLHVRVRDVRERMVGGAMAVKARIMFYGVEIEVDVLRGFLHEYTEPAVGVLLPGQCADIYYDRRQPLDWQRLVCCKELLHILDTEKYQVATPEKVKLLIEKIALPPGLTNISTDGQEVWGDRLMDVQAVAVLFPMAARKILMAAYNDEEITPANLARIARLPERYVRWVMSPQWETIYPKIVDLSE